VVNVWFSGALQRRRSDCRRPGGCPNSPGDILPAATLTTSG
jgi:hypothetical protein